MHKVVLSVLVLIMVFPSFAEAANEKSNTSNPMHERLSRIDWHNIKVGIESSFHIDYTYGAHIAFGLGSHRNTYGVDAGIKVISMNTPTTTTGEVLTVIQLPLYVRANCNVFRWDKGSLFGGGEVSLALPVSAMIHNLPLGNVTYDTRLAKIYPSFRLSSGIHIDKYELSVFGTYATAPMFNQKYIFETAPYDYTAFRPFIFNRLLFGVQLEYTIYSF